jgi:hypothetical protein
MGSGEKPLWTQGLPVGDHRGMRRGFRLSPGDPIPSALSELIFRAGDSEYPPRGGGQSPGIDGLETPLAPTHTGR